MRRLLPTLALLVVAGLDAATETFEFDPNHSSVTFSVRHFLAPVPGQFAKVTGRIEVDSADFTRNTVTATVEPGSVSTLNEKRDAHLRTGDFFDVASHPTATFRSRSWQPSGDGTYAVTGDLTLHGVTRELVVPVRYLGRTEGNRGAVLTGWQAAFTINRSWFGIGKPERSIGDEVSLIVNVEARLLPPPPPQAR
jgi:polyisoprenoid-binding protein YceI